MILTRHLRGSLLALALSLLAPTLQAQTVAPPTLEARYQQGADLRERHQDAEALAVFQTVYSESREARALAQIGMAEGALGRWLDAEQHIAEALASQETWIHEHRSPLEGALATVRAHLGQLEVQATAPNAEVWVDGRRLGGVNRPLRVIAGTTAFEVRAPGYVAVRRVATVAAGGAARETVMLTAVAPEATANGTANGTAPSTSPAAAVRVGSSEGRGSRRTLALALLISGGVVLAGGVAAWAYGWSATGDYNADPACPGPDSPGLPAQCQSRLDAARAMEPLGWTGMLLGAALVTTGGVLLGTAPRESGEATVRVTGGPGDLGLGMRVAF